MPPGSLKPPYYRTELWAPAYNTWRAVAEHLTKETAETFCAYKQDAFPNGQWRVIEVSS